MNVYLMVVLISVFTAILSLCFEHCYYRVHHWFSRYKARRYLKKLDKDYYDAEWEQL